MAERRTDVATERQEGRANQQTENQTRQENQTREDTQRRQDSQGRQDAQGRQDMPQERGMARRTPSLLMNPFALLGRLTEEMTNVFNDAGAGRGNTQGMAAAFAPDIDVVQRGNELVVRADLPGLSADDVMVEIGEDAITISGVRRQEHEEERGGVYRFERQFGAFSRVVPLPTGAITDQARAVFKDGVLEIHVPAPPEQVARGRRLEVSQGDDSKKQGGDSRK